MNKDHIIFLSGNFTITMNKADKDKLPSNIFVREVKNRAYAYVRIQKEGKRKDVIAARVILDLQNSKSHVRYLDGNGLNLTRDNIIAASRSAIRSGAEKKAGTTSKYRGVTKRKGTAGYIARIKPSPRHKQMSIGNYATEEEAAVAYNNAAKLYHGKAAVLNMLPEKKRL